MSRSNIDFSAQVFYKYNDCGLGQKARVARENPQVHENIHTWPPGDWNLGPFCCAATVKVQYIMNMLILSEYYYIIYSLVYSVSFNPFSGKSVFRGGADRNPELGIFIEGWDPLTPTTISDHTLIFVT